MTELSPGSHLVPRDAKNAPPGTVGKLLPSTEMRVVDEAVVDAAVIGVTDGAGNEIPKAYVVPRAGTRISEDDLIAYVAGQVAPYKKVRRAEFTDTVPRSATGKILRRELRARERSSTAP